MAEAVQGISVVIDEPDNSVRVDPQTGTVERDQDDGGVVVQFNAHKPNAGGNDDDKWFGNLVDRIGAGELSKLANELHDAVSADDRSRGNWLTVRARALDFLGLEIKEPRANVGDSSAPVEGQATVTNPLLLEACLKSWANEQAELLPSNGPVKIDDENVPTNEVTDDLADSFERDLNNWFCNVATEYYPDTSRMLLWDVSFGGSGFKKVYRCPLKRRPTSESVQPENLIVSDTTKDLRSCSRITHQIPMRPSVMKRMMALGHYRDIKLPEPNVQPNAVQAKIAAQQSTQPVPERPEDQPYMVWETQCELVIPGLQPKGFEDIPVPFVVTMDKESKDVLRVQRDWDEDDEDATRIRMYVKYPYVLGPGFYGTGLLNILGNASQAMTAAWRLSLDNAMYANYPAFLISKLAGRQNTSDLRVPPGTGVPIETGDKPIGQVAMPLPYKDVSAGMLALMDKITTQAQGLGSSAEIPTAEGVANVPVGTMLAQIEQATKVMAAAHKGMHTAQSEEIQLIIELFRRNPDDFFRGNKTIKKDYWTVERFTQALNDVDLIPRSDPNTPSHIHRIAKALGVVQLAQVMPDVISRKEAALRACKAIGEDPTNLVVDPQPQQQMPAGKLPDPLIGQAKMLDSQTKRQQLGLDAQKSQIEVELEKEKLDTQRQVATAELAREFVIHRNDTLKEQQAMAHDQQAQLRQHALDARQQAMDAVNAARDHALGMAEHHLNVHQVLHPPKPEKKAT